MIDTAPLPYATEGAVRFDNQADFHIGKYLLALADRAERRGCRTFEESRALDVDGGEPCTVSTAAGTVTADRVVVATHYPFLDRSLAFARVHPSRSYAIVCDTERRYRRLEEFSRSHWEVRSVDYRWSSQDNLTIDGMPYVGKLTLATIGC